jgi:hypothetical protein
MKTTMIKMMMRATTHRGMGTGWRRRGASASARAACLR